MTDVGSTKRALVGAVDDPRFIGGHPLAGAETAGVEHARADLFDGATWYLTPTAAHRRASLYERLHRLLARPRRAAGGDRRRDARPRDGRRSRTCRTCSPTCSSPRPRARCREGERLPATGPSFRDATRVAGANARDLGATSTSPTPTRWSRRSTTPSRRLGEVRDALAGARRRRGVARLERRRARRPPAAARGRPRRRRGARAARLGAEPPGRRRRGRARARARRRQHRRHGAVSRRRTTRRARRAVDRRRAPTRREAERLIGGARLHGGAAMNVRSRPRRPACAARSRAPPDKSISHRAALLGAMTAEPVRVTQLPRRGRHALDAAPRCRRSARSSSERADELADPRAGPARGRAADGAIDVGNAGTLMRLLPGLARRAGGRRVDARRRRVDPPPARSTASPSRCAQMGAQLDARDGPLPAVHGPRRAACTGIEYELPVACAQVKSCVLLAGLLADGRDDASSSPRRAATTPSGCSRAAGARVERDGDARDRRTRTTSSSSTTSTCPATRPRPRSTSPPAMLVPGSRHRARGRRRRTGRAPASCGSRSAWARSSSATLEEPQDGDPGATSRSPSSTSRDRPLGGTVVEADEVPLAIDELPLVALLGCFAEGETVVRGAAELRLKESDRIADRRRRPARPRRRHRGDRRRLRRARHRRPARRHDRRPRRPPAGDARRGRRPRLARGRRGRRDGGRRRLLPGLRGRPRAPARPGLNVNAAGWESGASRRAATQCHLAPHR